MSSNKNPLLKRAAPTAKNQLWVGDITFTRVVKDWSYLCVAMDRYKREIIGWSFNRYRSAEVVRESVSMSISNIPIESGLIFHLDQDKEYATKLNMDTLEQDEIAGSASRKGHCWDLAHMNLSSRA